MRLWTNVDGLIGISVVWVILSVIFSLVTAWQAKHKGYKIAILVFAPFLTVSYMLLYSHSNPLWIRVYKSSLWTENTYGFSLSKPIALTSIENVYISRSQTKGRGSYSFCAIMIVNNQDAVYNVGRADRCSQLIPARDQLTQLLEARGVKVSNDPPPTKP